jgi:monoamine oxidase
MEKEKVVIIGAGAAGLMAARTLQKNNLPFRILEATDRIGGRVFTKQGPFPIEYGPEFLHGKTPLTDQLLEEFHLPWYDLEFDYHLYLQGKLRKLPDFWERISEVFQDIHVEGDLPFSDYLEKSDHHSLYDQKITRAFVQGFDAADLHRISTRALSEMKDQVSDPAIRKMRRPLQGYGKLMEKLSTMILPHIFFSYRVDKITWREGHVKITGVSGEARVPFEISAEKLILTSSLGALKKITLDPMPENLTTFLSQNEMGQVVKVVATLEDEFFHLFPDNTFPFIAAPDLCFSAWWTTTPIHTNLITGWAGGEKARKLEGKTLEERTQIFTQELATLSGLCPTKVSSWIKELAHHDWGSDPSFSGAYSYPQVVREERIRPETVFQDTIYLAGEAFHEEMSGTVEGALRTGEAAAERVSETQNIDVGRPLRERRI